MSIISANIIAKETIKVDVVAKEAVKVNIMAGVGRDADKLDGKHASELEPAITEGTVYQCWKGNKSWQTTPYVDVRDYASFSVAIDAIGASEKTLLIPNEQAVAADKTVPANVTLKFLQGGSLNIATTKTVTINGHVEAGPYQIFKWAGTGAVALGASAVKEIYPEWWGASPSASAAVNSLGFIAALDQDKKILISEGTYSYDTSLDVPNDICIEGLGGFKTILSYTGAGDYGLKITQGTTLSGFRVSQSVNRTTERDGIRLSGSLNILKDVKVYGFKTGIRLVGDGVGCAYNYLYNLGFWGNFYDLVYSALNDGWCNENQVFGGYVVGCADASSYGIYINSATNPINGNRFFGVNIECGQKGVYCDGWYNEWHGCRHENVLTDFGFGTNSKGNAIYSSIAPTVVDASTLQQNLIIAGLTTKLAGNVESGEIFSFRNKSGFSIADDDVYSVSPNSVVAGILCISSELTGNSCIVNYSADASAQMTGLVLGANVNVTTGILTGTTGTDGKITVSAHTDGKIYVENRRGGTVYLSVVFLAGYGP